MTISTNLRFIATFPNISAERDFLLKDLPGSGRRIDVLCRTLASCFDWSRSSNLKRELRLDAVLSNTILNFTEPTGCKGKGEVWWAQHILNSLKDNPSDFITVEHDSLDEYIRNLCLEEPVFVLDEEGMALEHILKNDVPQYSFMLGNHEGFDENAIRLVQDLDLPSVSLGATSYLGSHCIAAIVSTFEMKGK